MARTLAEPLTGEARTALAEVYALLRRCAERKRRAAVSAAATAAIAANGEEVIGKQEAPAATGATVGSPHTTNERRPTCD